MRTTLDIDDDVLAAVKDLARRQGVAAGRILSGLARKALTGGLNAREAEGDKGRMPGGFRPFPPRGTVVSNDRIDELRDSEGL